MLKQQSRPIRADQRRPVPEMTLGEPVALLSKPIIGSAKARRRALDITP
jgi:hypothetical protein